MTTIIICKKKKVHKKTKNWTFSIMRAFAHFFRVCNWEQKLTCAWACSFFSDPSTTPKNLISDMCSENTKTRNMCWYFIYINVYCFCIFYGYKKKCAIATSGSTKKCGLKRKNPLNTTRFSFKECFYNWITRVSFPWKDINR